MQVRLEDVAIHAGVSTKTVSNVVNKKPHVSEQTRARVQASLDALGYRPNLPARQLKYGRTGFIGLALPTLDIPYFAELATKISHLSKKSGLITLLDITSSNHSQELEIIRGHSPRGIDGVIFSPLSLTCEEIMSSFNGTPIVLLGERTAPKGFDHVAVDSVSAAQGITEHLISLNRSKIAAIGSVPADGTASLRLTGYQKALSLHEIPVAEELIIDVPEYDYSSGYKAMKKLLRLSRKPDAVFCFNDAMALGAIRACLEQFIRIPEDIAIAGFDDICAASYCFPSLTTVSPDMDFLVATAVDLLIHRMDAQAEDGIRDRSPSRGLGDVYKRQKSPRT